MALGFTSDASAIGYIGERTIAIVVEEVIPLAMGMPHGIEQVRLDIDVEPAVAIVVAERRHDTRVVDVEPIGMGHFLEGPVALVDVEEIGGIEPTDIDVQQSVIVHVDKRRPFFPYSSRPSLVADSGSVGHILKFPATKVAKQPAAFGFTHDKDVRPAVAVIVTDGHAGTRRPERELWITSTPHLGIGIAILSDYSRLGGGKLGEHRRTRRT